MDMSFDKPGILVLHRSLNYLGSFVRKFWCLGQRKFHLNNLKHMFLFNCLQSSLEWMDNLTHTRYYCHQHKSKVKMDTNQRMSLWNYPYISQKGKKEHRHYSIHSN